jgi:hypothetical protein
MCPKIGADRVVAAPAYRGGSRPRCATKGTPPWTVSILTNSLASCPGLSRVVPLPGCWRPVSPPSAARPRPVADVAPDSGGTSRRRETTTAPTSVTRPSHRGRRAGGARATRPTGKVPVTSVGHRHPRGTLTPAAMRAVHLPYPTAMEASANSASSMLTAVLGSSATAAPAAPRRTASTSAATPAPATRFP